MALRRGFRHVVALAGGVGGAKLVEGLAKCLPDGALTVIGNTGDDFRHYGLHVSPDLDTVMYTLAGIAHPVNGWGIADDTRHMLSMLARYGEETWFGLGDHDLATNILRTHWLAQGMPLSAVTARLCQRLGVTTCLLPMTDDLLATVVYTVEYGRLAFQEYFVRHRWQPTVQRLVYEGAEAAQPAAGVLEALETAEAIIICPSNPLLSIEPILQVRAIREAIKARRAPCLAVSPIIEGAALKGPTVKIMRELGLRADVAGVSSYYGDLIDALVVDEADREVDIQQRRFVTNIRMMNSADRVRLAEEVLLMIGDLA
ncbi:MAG: 2-phospho-L-lactate transferase [Anaerolineae bacterium]|nr:2-phospho-L-lactate transferase [Anaerolineae bacterium]MDW8300542.1 2-phospho-L-lactate transferase [Anaerolineae bacterium]